MVARPRHQLQACVHAWRAQHLDLPLHTPLVVWLRVDEALMLVKELARKHGSMQQHTLNSVVRALFLVIKRLLSVSAVG